MGSHRETAAQCSYLLSQDVGDTCPHHPPHTPGQANTGQDGDGRVFLSGGGGGGVWTVSHCLHGGVHHEGGARDEAIHGPGVQ